MKFRDLKKKDFVLIQSYGEYYISHINGVLTIYWLWEYDNGLYITSGFTEEKTTWKYLKSIIQNDGEKFWVIVNSGKCPRCGVKLTESNYKNEIDANNIQCLVETDYFYCNDCKQKQFKEWAEFMLQDEEQE